MRIRRQDGNVEEHIEISDAELIALAHNSLQRLRGRSAIVECETCGRRILVNSSDFHLVRRCDEHR